MVNELRKEEEKAQNNFVRDKKKNKIQSEIIVFKFPLHWIVSFYTIPPLWSICVQTAPLSFQSTDLSIEFRVTTSFNLQVIWNS